MSKTFTVNTTHSAFDLFEYIESTPNVSIAAGMAQSVAWRIDSLIQNFSRQIFKSVRQDLLTKGVDGVAELSMALREQAFAEEAFHQSGSTVQGPVQNIKELMVHRESAHELAAKLVGMTTKWDGTLNRYEIPDIDVVFTEPVQMKVSRDQRRRITMSVERRASAYGLDEAQRGMLVDRRLTRAKDQQDSIAETLTEQQGAVHEMFRLAVTTNLDLDIADSFHTMDISVQRSLIESAMNAAQRAEDDATNSRSITDAEFDDVCIGVMKVEKDLKGVLASPRFVVREMAEA